MVNKVTNNSLGKRAGWISIIGNLALFVFKYWAGIVSGSVALIADAWHTITDSISSIIVLVGLKISSKPPDTKHPFGHGRAELISSIIVGIILAMISIEIFMKGIHSLSNHKEAIFGTLAIVVTIASILSKEALAQYSFHIARKTGYQSIKADGWHHRTDAISSLIILLGILISKYYWWIDGILGMAVAFMIFYTALQILKEGINPLLGEVPDEELVNKLKEISNRVAKQETNLHHVHIHRYGDHSELTFHIKLSKEMNLEIAHTISTAIEEAIKEEVAMTATIHYEPI